MPKYTFTDEVMYETFTITVKYDPDMPDDLRGILVKVAEDRIRALVPAEDILGIYHGASQRDEKVVNDETGEREFTGSIVSRVCLLSAGYVALQQKLNPAIKEAPVAEEASVEVPPADEAPVEDQGSAPAEETVPDPETIGE